MTSAAMTNHSGGTGTGALILVVEDVEETRDGIEDLLHADGYRVQPARDEAAAVRSARREAPALILVSLGGPTADVIAAGSRIRRSAALREAIPVVIFCADSVAQGAEVHLGGNVYATRPDSFDQLRRLLRRLLRELRPTACR
jgi:chemosensory pili system protein ChpA (sensor histidine kinase/response regulator)